MLRMACRRSAGCASGCASDWTPSGKRRTDGAIVRQYGSLVAAAHRKWFAFGLAEFQEFGADNKNSVLAEDGGWAGS